MRYFDPSRERDANGNPLWKGLRNVLPGIWIHPDEQGRWWIGLWVPHEGGGEYVARLVELGEVEEILAEWEADPEGALSKWWGRRISEKVAGGVKQIAREALDL